MKKIYVNPEVNYLFVSEEDVIRTSGNDGIILNDDVVNESNQIELGL